MRAIAHASLAMSAVEGTRRLRGTLVVYGELGYTTAGPLRVRPGGITVPDDLATVPLVKQHDPSIARGVLAAVTDDEQRMVVELDVDQTPEGDIALAEATGPDRVRAGISYYIEDIVLDDEGWVASSRLVHIGQVADPAYNSSRLEQIAASRTTQTTGTSPASNEGALPMNLTPEERARLAELLGQDSYTPEEMTEMNGLLAKATQPAPDPAVDPAAEVTDPAQAEVTDPAEVVEPVVEPAAQPAAASHSAAVPAVPAGVPSMASAAASTTSRPRGENAFETMISALVQAFEVKKAGDQTGALIGISAALSEVDGSTNTPNVEPLAWSGQLFAGVDFEPIYSPHFASAPLDHWEGKGWRLNQVPQMQDYAGDNAEIPTGTVVTEDTLWEAARAAVGFRIDEKYFDFPNGDFLSAVFSGVAETWPILLDGKCLLSLNAEKHEVSRAVTITLTNGDDDVVSPAGAVTAADVGRTIVGDGIPAGTTVLSITDPTHFKMSANATAAGAVSADVGIASDSMLKAVAKVSKHLKKRYRGNKAATAGAPDFLYVNDDDWEGLMDLTQFDVPAFLATFGVDVDKIIPAEDVAKGAVIAGVDRHANLRTDKRSPIIVDALALATGSIDKAFRGYWAIEQVLKRGVLFAHYNAIVEA